MTTAFVAYIEGAFTLMRESANTATLDQVAEAGALLEELGLVVSRESARMAVAVAYLFTGEPRGAEKELRLAREGLLRVGEKSFLSTVSALLALHSADRDATRRPTRSRRRASRSARRT